MPDVGETPTQPKDFKFPKRAFGVSKPVFRSFQPSWFTKWDWLHYDESKDVAYCFTCVRALKTGKLKTTAGNVKDSAFAVSGFANWKDATHGRFNALVRATRSLTHVTPNAGCRWLTVDQPAKLWSGVRKDSCHGIFHAHSAMQWRSNAQCSETDSAGDKLSNDTKYVCLRQSFSFHCCWFWASLTRSAIV